MKNQANNSEQRSMQQQFEWRTYVARLDEPSAYDEHANACREKRRAKKERKHRRRWWRGVRHTSEVMVVVLTLGVLWITSRQATIMDKQNAIMAISERAWITTNGGPEKLDLKAGTEIVVKIGLMNVGGSPARLRSIGLIEARAAAPTAPVSIDWGAEYSEVVLGPDQSIAMPRKLTLTQAEVEAIQSGKLGLYVFGASFYEDPLSDPAIDDHGLLFCWKYVEGNDWTFCATFNDFW